MRSSSVITAATQLAEAALGSISIAAFAPIRIVIGARGIGRGAAAVTTAGTKRMAVSRRRRLAL
ncbi:MAG TPA: hypothetical protein VLT33_27350 [Labilithrix sp.]|nr:hypothetical protein [Labilithrix sp.]